MVQQIFEITDQAAKQIKKASEISESSDWPLRISLSVDDNGKFNYLMGFDQSKEEDLQLKINGIDCLLYTSPSPRDGLLSRMPSSA